MNQHVKTQILEKIKEYNRIFLFRHIRGDGDCIGATKGLKRILQLTWPEKEIYIVDSDASEYMAFLGSDDAPVPDGLYTDALGIVIDTASLARISNQKYTLCKELIKIDHHIPVEDYGDLMWVEKNRSSACEMIVDFYRTFQDTLRIDQEAATYLYTGIVTDSGRFKYDSVTGDTLRNAALLLDIGVDTQMLFARLYLEPYSTLKFNAYLYEQMHLTENGVAHIYIDRAMQAQFQLTQEQASACVDSMDSILGCLCWMVFIENGDETNSIRVRLRSRFVPINSLAEKYRGGGHACACGATVYSQDEVQTLLQDADLLVKEYKQTHTDWL